MLDADTRKAKRHAVWPWVLGFPLLLAMVGMIATAGFLGSKGNQHLAEATAAADRDDPNWRIGDLLAHRETVPDAENSALILAELRSTLPENWPSGGKRPRGGQVSSPAAGETALDHFTALPDNVRMGDEVALEIRADLKEYRPGGSDRPTCGKQSARPE